MARETFYAHGFRSNKWARDNDIHKDVYPGNLFNWRDTSLLGESKNGKRRSKDVSAQQQKECQIRPINFDLFCETMQQHQIKRLFFVGDSLMGAQLESLIGLLGLQVSDYIQMSKKAVVKQRAIHCPELSISIESYRENLGPNYRETNLTGRADVRETIHFGPEIPYCKGDSSGINQDILFVEESGGYCPWHLRYNETKQKTLLVLNQGAHFHSDMTFSKSMDEFVTLFNSIAHSGDIVAFRATAPGHYDCWNNNSTGISVTNMTHGKFLERYGTKQYDWNLFDSYNQYAKKKMGDLVPSIISHYLNIYNMTVLRPDQHVRATDCLHYMHPGPIDFWNHLLFTNVADIAKTSH